MRVRVRKRWRLFRFDLDFCLFIATTYTLDCNGVGYRFWTITATTPDCAGREISSDRPRSVTRIRSLPMRTSERRSVGRWCVLLVQPVG